MIEAADLSVSYRKKSGLTKVLEHINLRVPTGNTCAVIGPSGCGKSTLLKVFAGIIHTYDGTVSIDGRPVNPAEQRIGFIPQNYGLLPWKTVEDNVRLGIKIKKPTVRVLPQQIQSILQQLGLQGLEKRYPGELSGGQQQRVGLARTFLLRPDVLLMDEPFSALDAITREEMQDVFFALWKKYAVTTVLVTHYVEEALYLGQKIVILSVTPGRITAVLDNPLFGSSDIRCQPEFFQMGRELRDLIKKGWKLS